MIHSYDDTHVTDQSIFVGNCGWEMEGGIVGTSAPSKVVEGKSLGCICIQHFLIENQEETSKSFKTNLVHVSVFMLFGSARVLCNPLRLGVQSMGT